LDVAINLVLSEVSISQGHHDNAAFVDQVVRWRISVRKAWALRESESSGFRYPKLPG
jgi:hypothetical protein